MQGRGFASQGPRWEGLSGCVVAKHAIPEELEKRGIHAERSRPIGVYLAPHPLDQGFRNIGFQTGQFPGEHRISRPRCTACYATIA